MKKIVCLLFVSLTLAAFAFVSPPNSLVGRWKVYAPGGPAVVFSYRADGSVDIFINGKTFVSGRYKVSQDTLSVADPTCNVDYYGTYRINFLTPDSLRLTVIADTCQPRSVGMAQWATAVRVKPKTP